MKSYHGSVIIAVIGGDPAPPAALEQAGAAGRAIAQHGCMLVCGGRGGVMEAACKGASEAGGVTIGVLPDADRSAMNPYVEIPIVTGMGRARNLVIALTADAVIAVDGGYGTLSEIAFALQHGKPVAGLGTWRFETETGDLPPIFRTDDAIAAVEWAIAAAGSDRSISAQSDLAPGVAPASKRRTSSPGKGRQEYQHG